MLPELFQLFAAEGRSLAATFEFNFCEPIRLLQNDKMDTLKFEIYKNGFAETCRILFS